MELFPPAVLQLRSPYDPEDVHAHLSTVSLSKRPAITGPQDRSLFWGVTQPGRFSLQLINAGFYSYVPNLIGTVSAVPGGSVLSVKLVYPMSPRAAAAVILIIGLALTVLGLPPFLDCPPLSLLAVPFSVGFTAFALLLFARYHKESEEYLLAVLDAVVE